MKIEEIVSMLIVLATSILVFYNPSGFSIEMIVVFILLALINWNVTRLLFKEASHKHTKEKGE